MVDGPAVAWYFEGHLAITSVEWKELPASEPFTTTSAPSLKVSGTTPAYIASISLPQLVTVNLYSRRPESRSMRFLIDPGSTNPWSCSGVCCQCDTSGSTSSTCL